MTMVNFVRYQMEQLEDDHFVVLEPTFIEYADALTVVGCVPVRALLYILNHPEKFIAVPLHKEHLPRDLHILYGDVVYLRPFADTAKLIQAPFGVDTVYAVKRREPKPRTGAYRLPAPSNR
jgi:hypothetical protein